MHGVMLGMLRGSYYLLPCLIVAVVLEATLIGGHVM